MLAAELICEPEAVERNGARCTIWRDAPRLRDKRTAAIGKFSCDSANAGSRLIEETCRRLTAEGFGAVLGPMEGDTWHSYRLVTETDGSRPFPLEPVSGEFDHAAFTGAGFMPISSYLSARAAIADAIEPVQPMLPGIEISQWDGNNAEALIGQVFDMSLAAFQRNAFYKPIMREAFLDLYRPIIPAMDKRFIFFARTMDGRVAGFMFAYPNVYEGAQPTTIIVKTYASGVRGAGRLLVDAVHRSARDHGFSHAIHALMHEDNQSRQRSGVHGGKVFRRYALLAREIG